MFLIAGAAVSLGASAQAQTLDQAQANRAELMADSSSRLSSLAPAAQEFTVNTHGYEQFRFNWNGRDDDGIDANNNDQTTGFQNARTRLNFSGNIGNENWGYFIQFGFGDVETNQGIVGRGTPSFSSGGFLEDAYGWYKMGNGWSLKFGQFKLPLFHETSIGDTYTLFADRSVLDSLFTQGRSQGVQIGYEGDQFHFYGAFSDGGPDRQHGLHLRRRGRLRPDRPRRVQVGR
jgi:phosphate-selective porin